MKKSLIKQLYYGEIRPADDLSLENPEYQRLTEMIIEEEEYFRGKFNEAERRRFEKIGEMYNRSSALYALENFAYGFRLGVRLAAEAICNSGNE